MSDSVGSRSFWFLLVACDPADSSGKSGAHSLIRLVQMEQTGQEQSRACEGNQGEEGGGGKKKDVGLELCFQRWIRCSSALPHWKAKRGHRSRRIRGGRWWLALLVGSQQPSESHTEQLKPRDSAESLKAKIWKSKPIVGSCENGTTYGTWNCGVGRARGTGLVHIPEKCF